jgi:cellobiose epimerase
LAARRHGVNLHMFEALLALYEATKSEEVWYEITSELKAIERLFDYEQGYFAESYDDNWKPGGNPTKTTRLHPRSTRCIVNT